MLGGSYVPPGGGGATHKSVRIHKCMGARYRFTILVFLEQDNRGGMWKNKSILCGSVSPGHGRATYQIVCNTSCRLKRNLEEILKWSRLLWRRGMKCMHGPIAICTIRVMDLETLCILCAKSVYWVLGLHFRSRGRDRISVRENPSQAERGQQGKLRGWDKQGSECPPLDSPSLNLRQKPPPREEQPPNDPPPCMF